MVKFSKDTIKPWTYGELYKLRKLALKKTPTHFIARKLGKTVSQVRAKASRRRCPLFN